MGYKIVLRACRAPLTQIAGNAGQDGGIVCEKVAEGKGAFGYNALTSVYEDLVKAGVIDPTKVTRTALQNASSVATLLLTSDALVAEKPKEEKGPRHAAAATRICTRPFAVELRKVSTGSPDNGREAGFFVTAFPKRRVGFGLGVAPRVGRLPPPAPRGSNTLIWR